MTTKEKLEKAKELIRVARTKLKTKEHSDGCSCYLCSSTRILAEICGILDTLENLFQQPKSHRTTRKARKRKKTKKKSRKTRG